jgi:hypothetical protein
MSRAWLETFVVLSLSDLVELARLPMDLETTIVLCCLLVAVALSHTIDPFQNDRSSGVHVKTTHALLAQPSMK